jgi:hypothetical protein
MVSSMTIDGGMLIAMFIGLIAFEIGRHRLVSHLIKRRQQRREN